MDQFTEYSQHDDFSFLLVNTGRTTYVFTMDMVSGKLIHYSTHGIDVFDNPESAREHIKDSGYKCKWKRIGFPLIGYIVEHDVIIIYAVKEKEQTAVIDKFPVYTIKSVDQIVLPLATMTTKYEPSILNFPVSNNHFYSFKHDFSGFYPYKERSFKKNDFIWNQRWKNYFEQLGYNFCVDLYQGICSSLNPKADDACSDNLTLILRRNSLNSGTRYQSRGLDKNNDAANECLVEIIITRDGNTMSHALIRGSPPINWKTEIVSPLLPPVHSVSRNINYANTHIYLNKIKERYNLDVVNILSLLEDNKDDGETSIRCALEESLVGLDFVTFFNFNLNFVLKQCKNNKKSKEYKYNLLLSNLFDIFDERYKESITFNTTEQRQSSIIRFSCMDSLDRTNLATFYYILYIIARFEFFKEDVSFLGISQNVTNFICKSFLDAGDLVSRIYTNTNSIKIKPIAMLLTKYKSTGIDSMTSIERRYSNIMIDGQKNLIFESFLDTEEVYTDFSLDPRHLCLIKKSSDYTVEKSVFFTGAEFKERMGILIGIPEELRLSKVCIDIPKQETYAQMSISVGNENNRKVIMENIYLPIGQKFVFDISDLLVTSLQFPKDDTDGSGRFVDIFFKSDGIFCFQKIKLLFQTPTSSPCNFIVSTKSEVQGISDFKTIESLCEFEQRCIRNGIGIHKRNEYLISCNMNPCYANLLGRLLVSPGSNTCSFCGASDPALVKFDVSLNFPNLICRNAEGKYNLCPACCNKYESCVSLSSLPDSNIINVNNYVEKKIYIGEPKYINLRNFSIPVGGPNKDFHKFIYGSIDKLKLNRGENVFEFILFEISELTAIIAEFDSNVRVKNSVSPDVRSKVAVIEHKAKESRVVFEVHTDEEVYLTNLHISGQVCPTLLKNCSNKRKLLPFSSFKSPKSVSVNEEYRFQEFSFQEDRVITHIKLQYKQANNHSLLFVHYKNQIVHDTYPLVIPLTSRDDIIYVFNINVSASDVLRLYYLDKGVKFTPFSFAFRYK